LKCYAKRVKGKRKPRLLDLFCGAGGCAKGYQQAGFYVVGIDIKPQKHYCGDEFHQADALEYLEAHGREFDVIHASPPCQAYSTMKYLPQAHEHPELVEPVRKMLLETGKPFIIENVPGAPLQNPVILCGSMFNLRSSPERYLRRHRLFESNILLMRAPCKHRGLAVGVYGHGSAGHLGQRMRTANVAEARILMGIDWMNRDELAQAIPPAYTEFIGRQLMQYLEV
jgi:DNA (cytosine-5)-methyltransferase 1